MAGAPHLSPTSEFWRTCHQLYLQGRLAGLLGGCVCAWGWVDQLELWLRASTSCHPTHSADFDTYDSVDLFEGVVLRTNIVLMLFAGLTVVFCKGECVHLSGLLLPMELKLMCCRQCVARGSFMDALHGCLHKGMVASVSLPLMPLPSKDRQ